MISNLNDLAVAVTKLDAMPECAEAVEDYNSYRFVMSSSPAALQALDDATLDLLVEVEHSAGYYLLTPEGLVNKIATKRLRDHGLDCVRLDYADGFFTHAVVAKNFSVPFAA